MSCKGCKINSSLNDWRACHNILIILKSPVRWNSGALGRDAGREKKGNLSRQLGKELPCRFLFPVHAFMIPYPVGKKGRI
jgi:hypothetical protein